MFRPNQSVPLYSTTCFCLSVWRSRDRESGSVRESPAATELVSVGSVWLPVCTTGVCVHYAACLFVQGVDGREFCASGAGGDWTSVDLFRILRISIRRWSEFVSYRDTFY